MANISVIFSNNSPSAYDGPDSVVSQYLDRYTNAEIWSDDDTRPENAIQKGDSIEAEIEDLIQKSCFPMFLELATKFKHHREAR